MSQTKVRRIEIAASATQTASGQTGSFDIVGDYDEINIYCNTSAVSGTSPTMDIFYLTSPDGIVFYFHTAMAQITATGQTLLKVPANIGKYCSLFWSIGGTSPSFTFTLDAVLKKRW